MIRRILLALFVLASLTLSSLYAQAPRKDEADGAAERSRAPSRSQTTEISAKTDALEASGTTRDLWTDDELVARALYVKVRSTGSPTTAVDQVLAAARQAGLAPYAATPLTMSDIPLAPSIIRRKGATANQGKVTAQSEGTLRSIVELHYGAPLHPRQAAGLLAGVTAIEYAEPIQLPRLLAPPNDPMIDQQYHLSRVRAFEAWEIWQGDTSVTIGIVDAGIDYGHQDLVDNIQENPGEQGTDNLGRDRRTNGVDDDDNGAIDDWRGANLAWRDDDTAPGETRGSAHGTQVSGLAAATTNNGIGVAGVGYRCRFFPVKAASNTGGLLTHAYEGLLYCARRGCAVINCSWGSTGYSQTLQEIIRVAAVDYDCAIVAGAGNSPVYTPFFPAGYPGVLGVAALDISENHATSWGEQVGISSPGGFTTSDGDFYLDVGTATSFAAPLVSGTVALVRSRFPSLSAAQALAHVRLTSDPLTSQVVEKQGLTGYGRLNVERAVGTDPFSHPAVTVDSITLVDRNGTPTSRLTVGDSGALRLRLRNILGEARGLRIRVVHYTDDRELIAIDSSWIDLGTLSTNGSVDIPSGIPFNLLQTATDRIRFRIEMTAEGYNDYQYARRLFYQPYITEQTSTSSITLTDRGRIGFDDLDNTIGEGVTFQGKSMLYEGGFIIASDDARVLSNTRNGIPSMQQEDFRPVDYPSSSNGYTLTLLDDQAFSGRAIGLRLKVRLLSDPAVPNAVAVDLATTYTGEAPIDTLRFAMFADWDLDNDSYGQGVSVKTRPPGSLAPMVAVVSGDRQTVLAHGVMAPLSIPIAYPFRNDTVPFDLYNTGFDDGEKWRTVSNGIGVTEIPRTDSSDVSVVIGRARAMMPPQGTDTTVFVIGFGESELEATTAMDDLAARLMAASSVPGLPPIRARLLSTPWPNPATDRTASMVAPTRNARLTLVNAIGEVVRDLTEQIALLKGPALLSIDLSGLPSGLYLIRLESDEGTWTEKVVKE